MAKALTCDGCGKAAPTAGSLARVTMLPPGWVRLTVTGRPGGAPSAETLGVVEVCSRRCASRALIPSFHKTAVDNLGRD